MKEFVIPLEKDELLRDVPGQYVVENVVSIHNLTQALNDVKQGLSKNGPAFILDHFDTFFSVMLHGSKVEILVAFSALNRLIKGLEVLIQKLESIPDINALEMEEKSHYRCIIKMMSYLMSNLVINLNNQISNVDDTNFSNIGKRKKATKKTDNEEEWESLRQKIFLLLHRWIQLPLQNFWHPPIVEDAFITNITQACYKVLETLKENSLKQMSSTIFDILGTFIKRFSYGVTCVIHIIQLVKSYENLAAPMSQGIIYMVTKCNCKGLIEKIIQEIGNTEIEDSNAKNIAIFLETLSTQPTLLLPVLDDLVEYLSNESYAIRNCILDIMGNIVVSSLTGENLDEEQKEQRDMCLDMLLDHILDGHAYVRSKVLQIWQRLCCEGAVPLTRQGKLLKSAALRLEDKGALVRKQALQLLRVILQGNPFAAKMNKEDIKKQLQNAEEKLTEIQAAVVAESGPGADVRFELWESHGPKIQSAIKEILDDKENKDNYNGEVEINDDTFEQIRQFMLKGKIKKAVILTHSISRQVYGADGMDNVDSENLEKALLAMLYKIFIDSKNVQKLDMKKDVEGEKQLNDRERQVQVEKIKTAKKLVTYLTECFEFADELEKALPLAENLLFSLTIGDAVESCTFLGTAYQFSVQGAEKGFMKALFQVFYRDQSVCKNVALVYKEVYLANEPNQTDRQRALISVSKLLELLKSLEGGQVKALSHLVGLWRTNNDFDNEIIKVLWETFAMKITNSTAMDSRGALLLLSLVAQSDPAIIIENQDALIKIGFGPRSNEDLLLARDTCRALLKIKQTSSETNVLPIRYPNDHEIFSEVTRLLVDNYAVEEEKGFASYAVEAINVIYHLADQPEELIKQVLIKITKDSQTGEDKTISGIVLRNYLIIVGHVAIRQMVHMDIAVYKELKRRNALKDSNSKSSVFSEKKNTDRRASNVSLSSTSSASHSIRHKESLHNNSSISEETGEEGLEGASADDVDAEYISNYLEKDMLNEKSLLYQFVPSVLEVCQNPDKYNNEEIQAAGVLALSKFMTISSLFCKQHLQLLVTILQKSPYSGIRSNIIVGLTDLMSRFPNQVEPWTSHIYGRLQDSDVSVRVTCVKMLSSLIMREMIRVKGQVAELALCIMDSDHSIRQHTKQFFKDLSQKGNSLYNIMPDIISCLTNPERNVETDKFEEVIKFILSLLQKEKHIDSIIEKICSRFKLASTDSQLQNLSYCLSLLQFNVKSIKYLIEFLPQMKDIIHHKSVYRAMMQIVDQGKKKAETTAAATELEEKINELLDMPENAEALADKMAMPPPRAPPKRGRNKIKKSRKNSESESDESDDDSELIKKRSQRNQKNKKQQKESSSESDSDSELYQKPKKPGKANNRKEKKESESDSDSDDTQKQEKPKSRRMIKRAPKSDSDSEKESRSTTSRKQKMLDTSKKTGVSPLPKKGRNAQPTMNTRRSQRTKK